MSNTLVISALERIKQRITENIRTSGEWASGMTAKRMRIEETENGGILWGRAYFQSLEDGRPAGKVPRNFTEIIKQWIIDKGLTVTPIEYKTNRPHKYTPQERGLNTMAGAIAHFIAANGTLLYRAGGRDDIYSNVINEEIDTLKRKLIENTITSIAKTLKSI